MRINFSGNVSGRSYTPHINSAVFTMNGAEVTIDRDVTSWRIENGVLHMTWERCYLWAIDGDHIFCSPAYLNAEEAEEFLAKASFSHFEYEDDFDDEELTDVSFSC